MTWFSGWRRTRREVATSALVIGGLTVFVVLVYVVVVLGGGVLVGRTSSPDLVLSVVATVIVAVAFDRVQRVLERTAHRVVHGDATPPYDVLERFASTITGSYPVEEVPSRMARVLAEGTGARATEVWLTVQDRATLAATWPPGADRAPVGAPGRRELPVRYAGEALGVLVVQEQAPLTAVEERLFAGLADQAGLVLRSAALRVQLQRRADELTARADELRASRQRLVDLQDERRRVLERDIHDALAVNLRPAQTLAGRSPERARELLATQEQAAADAIDTLVQLSRGIYPPLLADEGLTPAVRAAAATSPVPVTVVAEVGRYDARIEAAAYFACLEALQNASKLALTIEDDGRGFDPSALPRGGGLANLRDRVESVGGTLTTVSVPGRGTRIEAVLPARVVEVV